MALTKVTNDLLTLDAAQPSITSTGTLTGLTVGVSADSDSVATITSTATSNNTQLRLGTNGNDSVISGTGGSTGGLVLKVYGSERLKIDAGGRVTMPSQPAFLIRAAGLNNLPLGYSTLTFDNEKFDVGANLANNTFTAPVTGKYQLSFIAMFAGIDNSASFVDFLLTTSNNVFENAQDYGVHTGTAVYSSFGISILADMDAGDTAICQYYQSGGNATADFSGASYFSGYLAC